MLESIILDVGFGILSFFVLFLLVTAILYYMEKQPLKESIGDGLLMGTALTWMYLLRYPFDYQLIIVGSIIVFLLQTVNRYYAHKDPLKDSIGRGLIVGIVFVIINSIFDFLGRG